MTVPFGISLILKVSPSIPAKVNRGRYRKAVIGLVAAATIIRFELSLFVYPTILSLILSRRMTFMQGVCWALLGLSVLGEFPSNVIDFADGSHIRANRLYAVVADTGTPRFPLQISSSAALARRLVGLLQLVPRPGLKLGSIPTKLLPGRRYSKDESGVSSLGRTRHNLVAGQKSSSGTPRTGPEWYSRGTFHLWARCGSSRGRHESRRTQGKPLSLSRSALLRYNQEWRFIIYIVPVINLTAAMTAAALWKAPKSKLRTLLRLGIVGLLALNSTFTVFSTWTSSQNYPGGDVWRVLEEVQSGSIDPVTVHLGNLALQTGSSLFTFLHAPHFSPAFPPMRQPQWVYSKSEDARMATPLGAWESGLDYVVTDEWDTFEHWSEEGKQWTLVGQIEGLQGIHLVRAKRPQDISVSINTGPLIGILQRS